MTKPPITTEPNREEHNIEFMNAGAVDRKEREMVDSASNCEECGNAGTVAIPLTFDHIIPKSTIGMFGLDPERLWDEENGRVVCYRCNRFKNHQLDFANPKTKKLLFKYLTLIP